MHHWFGYISDIYYRSPFSIGMDFIQFHSIHITNNGGLVNVSEKVHPLLSCNHRWSDAHKGIMWYYRNIIFKITEYGKE